MRIEINLLPGAKRGQRKSKGGAIDFKALGAAIAAQFKDVWLTAAIGSGALAAAVIGVMFLAQTSKAAALKTTIDKAVADSSRYAVVLKDRARAEAKRDSALTQLTIIRAIDEDRFIWPHILDEISRAMQPYLWLRTVTFTGTPQGTNPAAAYRPPPPDTTKGRKKVAFMLPRDTIRLRITGRTPDLGAFTRFNSALEDSPFLGAVNFTKIESMIESGKDIRTFELELMFTRPDSSLLRRVPLTIPPRQ